MRTAAGITMPAAVLIAYTVSLRGYPYCPVLVTSGSKTNRA